MDRVGPREWAALQTLVLIGRAGGSFVSAWEVSEYLEKSLSYTEVILIKLRQSGFLVSNRGPRGGYILGHDTKLITVAAVMETLQWAESKPVSDDLRIVTTAIHNCLEKITIDNLL